MKIAIIGLGVVGNIHAQILNTLGTPPSALCDIVASKAEAAREKYAPNAKVYTDWRVMLEEFAPDAVHICTPHYLHAEMTITALNKDINVLCEKPLCIHVDEIGQILEAEQRSKGKLGVSHQNRYNNISLFLKNYLADKEIVGAHGSVAWKRGKSYYDSAEWRGTAAMEGGGVLINQALHTFDMMMWLCGEPDRISAIKGNLTLQGEIEVEDTVAIHCFGNVDYSFFATVGSAFDFPTQMNFKLAGGENVIVLPKTVIVNGEVIESDEIDRYFGKACYGDSHIRLIEDFYRCIGTGEPFPINGTEAAKVVRMILAAYESKGEVISL